MANNQDILLISSTYVKKRLPIMRNVEDQFILSHIFESQDIHIQDIIGSRLYDNIISEYQDYKAARDTGFTGSVTGFVSTQNVTLVTEYIKPTLLYYSVYESMYDLNMKITNKGIVQQSSDFSEPVENFQMEKKRKNVQNKAEFYAQRLIGFLCDNDDTYILYRDWVVDGAPKGTMAPEKDTNYFNGIYLD